MTDMQEKVARALDPVLWERWDKEVDMYLPEYKQARLDKPWTKIIECLKQAKAAIEAYREPTDEMIDRSSRARVAVRHKMPSALTLKEYAAPNIMEEDRLGMREALQAAADAALEGNDEA